MEVSIEEYIKKYYSWFEFVVGMYVGFDTNENKPIIDDMFYEYEYEIGRMWAVGCVIFHLKYALKNLPEMKSYILAQNHFYPPGVGPKADEEDYRNWMKSLLRDLKDRMAEYQARSTDEEDLYFEKEYPAFRELLIWFASYSDDIDTAMERIFHVHQSEPGFAKPMISEVKLVLGMEPFPSKYIQRVLGSRASQKIDNLGELGFQLWLENVLRQLEERVG